MFMAGMEAQTDTGSRLWVDLNPWDTQGEAFTSVLKAPAYPQTLILTSLSWSPLEAQHCEDALGKRAP